MSVTVTSITPAAGMTITDSVATAITDTIVTHLEDQAACAAAAIQGIYESPLSCGGTTAADIEPVEEPCCRTEELTDVYEAGDMVIRETCSDGAVTDTVTYVDGQVCSIVVNKSAPTRSIVAKDENCQPMLVGVEKSCKARLAGEPYDEYFIPLCSDFENQVYCVPGTTYAFAWDGVENKNIKEFIEDNDIIPLLQDPTNQYVAIVNGEPYACGVNKQATNDESGNPIYCFDCSIAPTDVPVYYGHTTSNTFNINDNPLDPNNTISLVNGVPYRCFDGEDTGLLDGNGNPVYCYPAIYADELGSIPYGHTTQDANAIDVNTYSTDADGNFIECVAATPSCTLHPLQVSQFNRLAGCYSPILTICPAWDGKVDTSAGIDPNPDVSCPEIEGKTASAAYYSLWADYWKCEKQDKFLRRALLGVQGVAALAGLVASIETYNKILDKQLDIMCRVEEDNALLAACSRSLLGTDEEPGILKECQANLLAGHNDRIGTINNRGVFACTVADDEINCYEQLWRPMQKKHAPHIASELHTMLENGKFSSENSMSWADSLEECISSNMLPELKRQFAPLLSSVNCTSENLNEWRSDLKQDANELQNHFNRVYKTNEATMIPQIMEMSTCMVQRVCEMRDWLYDCARCDLNVYKEGYQSGEVPQARAAMSNAAQLIPKLVESVSWLERNIPAALNIFEACYAKEVATLNPALFDNARDLAPEIQNCFKWLKENSKEHTQFFQDCYRDRECQIVTKNMDLALKLTSAVQESLCRLDTWSQEDRGMYDLSFRDLERTKTQDLVKNGNEASNDLQDFRGWFVDRTHEFHDTYHDNWLPCDIANLKYHCDVWNKSNPLLEILDNGEMLNSMVNNNKEMYQKGIIHADTYLDTVFEEADKFDYCVEDAATHHVRKRYDQAIEEARRCTQSYAKGSLDYITTTLKAQNARDEGAAYARASRWAWWANNQLDSITHERRLTMLQYIEAIGGRMLEATNASTASYDTLLARMNEALGRGNNYLANMQDSGRAGISIMGNELDTMLRTIQQWHFWPELAQQGNVQFNAGVAQVHDQAQQLVQLGHYWPEMAFREKQEAHGIAARAIDVGVNLSQIGQFYLSQADSMNSQRANMSNQSGQLGNQFAQTGHNLHRLASDKAMNAMQQSIAAGGLGVNAGQLGAQHMATALEIENKMTLNALEHLRAGISAMTLGVDFLGEVRQTQQLAGSYGINAATQLLNLFKHGQNNALLALNASEQCKETEFEMLCKAKDYVMQNYEVTQRSLQGYSAGQLSAAQNALNAQGNNAGSAFGLLGNSLEGLLTNNSTPPFPTGGPTFGTGQFGFNGGAFT